jgi:hypothetical protein
MLQGLAVSPLTLQKTALPQDILSGSAVLF